MRIGCCAAVAPIAICLPFNTLATIFLNLLTFKFVIDSQLSPSVFLNLRLISHLLFAQGYHIFFNILNSNT